MLHTGIDDDDDGCFRERRGSERRRRRTCPFDLNYEGKPKEIVVGGSALWNFGFNYVDWAIKNAPFHQGETLDTGEYHTRCRGGFKYVLKTFKPYHFACGEKDSFHCNNGTMKFSVKPVIQQYS
ncbi:hypothetical protein VNO77_42205 [Canavalia gladiata]|uniref:Phytocyanin domain-containing protein n=1 Tax=Canavalia gladiata TaxID=3824 RepID=A0AAN9PS73_CANGL